MVSGHITSRGVFYLVLERRLASFPDLFFFQATEHRIEHATRSAIIQLAKKKEKRSNLSSQYQQGPLQRTRRITVPRRRDRAQRAQVKFLIINWLTKLSLCLTINAGLHNFSEKALIRMSCLDLTRPWCSRTGRPTSGAH